MKTISATQLRSRTRSLVRSLAQGKAVSLTYRGRDLARIFPVRRINEVSANDVLYSFHKHALKEARLLTDREMDSLVYGP